MNESLGARVRDAGAIVRVGYPLLLSLIVNRRILAITIGRRIWIDPRAAELGAELLERVVRHELVHVAQYRRDGVWGFLLRYGTEYLRGRLAGMSHGEAYRGISYEREAYANEQ